MITASSQLLFILDIVNMTSDCTQSPFVACRGDVLTETEQ